jgi:hypothetical protein
MCGEYLLLDPKDNITVKGYYICIFILVVSAEESCSTNIAQKRTQHAIN